MRSYTVSRPDRPLSSPVPNPCRRQTQTPSRANPRRDELRPIASRAQVTSAGVVRLLNPNPNPDHNRNRLLLVLLPEPTAGYNAAHEDKF